MSRVEDIADVVLYEGYNLYPYRPSAIKNRMRWTFGVLYPRPYAEQQTGDDDWRMQTECLVVGDSDTVISVRLRFLQLAEFQVSRKTSPDAPRQSESVCVPENAGAEDVVWQDAIPRQVDLQLAFDTADASSCREFKFAPGDMSGAARMLHPIAGWVELSCRCYRDDLFKFTVRVHNRTLFAGAGDDRQAALLRSLVATHAILRVRHGAFVSHIDPPDDCRDAAEGCRNIGTWPVLAGEPGSRHTMLSAPIILYDYPRVAPESPGNFFDATEVDELLVLRIQSLTDGEKREMAAVDQRTRRLLDRTESLGHRELARLHGAVRDDPMDSKPRSCLHLSGKQLRRGSRVRLVPQGRADAFDIVLRGMTATVETIEQDFEDNYFVTVTVDDDPGRDFGRQGQIGHRFYFRMDEVEPLDVS